VQAEALVRQIGDFARFLEVISFSHASMLNLASLAREAEIPRKRAEAYLEILEDLLLAFRLPVFQRRARRQLVQHQKLYVFDAGVFRSLSPRGPLDAPAEIEGLALEGLVAQFSMSVDIPLLLAALAALVGEVKLASNARCADQRDRSEARIRAAEDRECTARRARIQARLAVAQCRFLLTDSPRNRLQLSETLALLLEDLGF
jgi:hypothetical protein